MRNTTILWIAVLGFTLCCASSAHAQPTSSDRAAADSAEVFGAVVDWLIRDDAANAGHAATDPRFNELLIVPRVFVRIARMPKGDWAKPGVARLRAHRWFYDGRAMDSTRALAQRRAVLGLGLRLRTTPFPAELYMALEFTSDGDTARVAEYWAWNTCEEGRGMLGIFANSHLVARTAYGWHWVERKSGGIIDALC